MNQISNLESAFSQAGVGVQRFGTDALRVNLAGNQISTLITPKNITPLERVFRRNTVDGTLTASPERPFSFELGAIDVPSKMMFVMLDTRFAIYVPSGLIPGDTEELEDRRLSTSVGYDVLFTDSRMDNIEYQLEPSNPALATDSSASSENAGLIPGDGISGVAPSVFARLRAEQATGPSASGLSTLPQRHRRDSHLTMPFTYLVSENKRVNFRVACFRPIPFPVAFFEVDVTGFLIGKNVIEQFSDRIVTNLASVGSY
jgi:hypothetical protein